MKRRRVEAKIRGALCAKFGIPWDVYPSLTVLERDALIEAVMEEQAEMNRRTSASPRSHMERIV